MKNAAIVCALLLVGAVQSGIMAQTIVNIGTTPSVTGCDFIIYDDGGNTGNYGPSNDHTLTIYPSANEGCTFLEIDLIDIHHNDTLFIYDGTTATGTPLAAINNMVYNNYTQSVPSSYIASVGNTSGALTIRFKTSGFLPILGGHGTGFALHATCLPICNPFQINFDTALCSHIPVLDPDDGYLYLDVCPDEQVHLSITGTYPNQGTSGYSQSDSTTTFTWKLEPNVTLVGTGMNDITHTFTPGSGFEVTISAKDTIHCPVSQPLNFRVRASKSPVYQISSMPTLCAGEAFTPEIGYIGNNDINLQQVGYSEPASLSVSDTIFLPDGDNCPPYGLFYRSYVNFTNFSSNATVTDANDILYVRIKMEHSAIEDLKIDIFCPNGSSTTILPNPNWISDGTYIRINFGSAYRPDDGGCNTSLNPMGTPWNYIWSNNNTSGYQYAPGNGSCYSMDNFHSHFNPHWDDSNIDFFNDMQHSFSVDSSDVTGMTQIYHPFQNFNTLVGCPLNGNWYIQVQDMLPFDNGYVVEWELALNQDLMPENWGYSIGIDTFYFTGDQVIDGKTLRPTTSGSPEYGFTLFDEFGCRYDTTFNVTVLDPPVLSLGDDKRICRGENVTLQPVSINSNVSYTWSTGETGTSITVSDTGIYVLSASILENGDTICQSRDTVEVSEIPIVTENLFDEVCPGQSFKGYGFCVSAEQLAGGTFTDSLTLTAATGCDSLVKLHLTVLDTTLKVLSTSPNLCATGETVLSVEGGFDSYLWSNGTVGNTTSVTQGGLFTVTASYATMDSACERTVQFTVPECPHPLTLPNAITPSKKDGINDAFELDETDRAQIEEFSIEIFNRWGELIFHTNDKHFSWDGAENNKRLYNSIYNYIIRYTDIHGKTVRLTGNIMIL